MIDDKLHKDPEIQRRFTEMQKQFIGSIRRKSPSLEKYGFLHATPVLVREDNNFKEVYETLMTAVQSLVLNYNKDKELQKIVTISPRALDLMGCCSKQYDMGSLRPDFLIDEQGNFKINEINARFAFNGYMISRLMNESLDMDGLSVSSLKMDTLGAFRRISGNTSVIKGREPDWGISIYSEALSNLGYSSDFVKPEELTPDGILKARGKKLESIVIELQQDEILNTFNKDIVRALQNHPHLNDLRTILIAHDKRMLDALYKPEIMLKYITPKQYQIIKPHLIETYAINKPEDMRKETLKDKKNWVLKHAKKGKCLQVYIGSELDDKEWSSACEEAKKGPFIAQKKIEQKKITIYTPHLGEYPVELFGMLMGVDGKFISQGAYRGTFKDPTSLTDGWIFVPPAIEKN